MIYLDTALEGKKAYFGHVQSGERVHGYVLGGNWEYDRGCFDTVLSQEDGKTVYVRLPFRVLDGELDRHDAYIEFGKPYVIKHVVHTGLDRDENSLLTATGFNQFQDPVDEDGQLRNKSKWEEAGERAVQKMVDHIVHH